MFKVAGALTNPKQKISKYCLTQPVADDVNRIKHTTIHSICKDNFQ